jgi:nicotinamide-nucleotide amidase
MFDHQVKPYLQGLSGATLVSHNVHLYGIGESSVEHQLRAYMESHVNPTIAPYAKEGEVLLRVTAQAENAAAAEALIAPVLTELREELGDYIYGIDVGDLQTALVQTLRQQGKTVAVAESCTGGLVGKRITEVPGASQVFGCGLCTYSNEMKRQLLHVRPETLERHGAVSAETALEMARGVRMLSGADIGVSVTGIAGPEGGTAEKPVGLVYIGLSTTEEEKTKELHLSRNYGGGREYIRWLASSNALHVAWGAACSSQFTVHSS